MSATTDGRRQPPLNKVLKYVKTGSKGQAVQHRVICAGGNKHKYEMGLDKNGTIFAVCDDFSTTCIAPAPSMFATERGVVFFDPHEMHEVMVTDRSGLKPCRFGNRCTKKKCQDGHKFPCKHGVKCRARAHGGRQNKVAAKSPGLLANILGLTMRALCRLVLFRPSQGRHDVCKFLHPSEDSVVPLGSKFPLNTECKFGTSCTDRKCRFAHPKGRVKITRVFNNLKYTHAPDLELLDKTVDLRLTPPRRATMFSFQGEFVFFFTPYPGPHAKEYFKEVHVFRYNAGKQKHVKVGTWSERGHYVNAATAQGKVMVISYWPYNDEACRAIWEGARRERSLGKVIKNQGRTIKKQNARIQNLDSKVVRLRSANSRLRREKAEALRQKRAAYAQMLTERKTARRRVREERQARLIAQQREREARRDAWQARRAERVARAAAAAARRRSERWRMLDPIHIYVADGSGAARSDWTLVLDYHKGAHDLELGPAHRDGTPRTLFITENKNRFEFDLSVLDARRNLRSLGHLPIVPKRLCKGF